jgi:2-polyprenyl-6-methoxyphenol hydroxylase-like FAD-dependent oxidoreductase
VTARCVVVGAGIVGSRISLRLVQQGADVTAVEGHRPGYGMTAALPESCQGRGVLPRTRNGLHGPPFTGRILSHARAAGARLWLASARLGLPSRAAAFRVGYRRPVRSSQVTLLCRLRPRQRGAARRALV